MPGCVRTVRPLPLITENRIHWQIRHKVILIINGGHKPTLKDTQRQRNTNRSQNFRNYFTKNIYLVFLCRKIWQNICWKENRSQNKLDVSRETTKQRIRLIFFAIYWFQSWNKCFTMFRQISLSFSQNKQKLDKTVPLFSHLCSKSI